MTWRPVLWLASSVLWAGCGLTLDLEPPDGADAALADFGVPKDDGVEETDALPPVDLGDERDQGSMEADSGARDSGTDLGPPDMGPRRACSEGCDPNEVCQPTVSAVCLDVEGVCVPRPSEDDCLRMPEEAVCGCDYRTYRNDCAAASAGVTVAIREMCPDFGDVDDWCDRTAPPQTMVGCVPCYDDADCFERTTTAFHCIGSTCSENGVGRCAFNLPLGDCYYDRDCRAGEVCDGSILYGCEDTSLIPVQGSCR